MFARLSFLVCVSVIKVQNERNRWFNSYSSNALLQCLFIPVNII